MPEEAYTELVEALSTENVSRNRLCSTAMFSRAFRTVRLITPG